MNRTLLTLGLATAASLIAVADLSAWGRRHRYESIIICRPYNAFTPVCHGRMVCDGCCPAPCCGQFAIPSFQGCMPPAPAWGGACCSVGAPVMHGTPVMFPGNPNVTQPPPLANPNLAMYGMQPNIHPAAYQPYYYPMPNYYPAYPTAFPMMPYAYGYPMPGH